MVWLPDGEKISKISLFVLTQLTNVTDTQTDRHTHRQTPHDGIVRAYASHRAAITKEYKNLAIANRSRVSCAHNTFRPKCYTVTLKSRLRVT